MLLFLVISYDPLIFCGLGYDLSSFISDFIYLGILSFFLNETVYPSKRLLLNSLIFLLVFINIYLLFPPDLFIFFLFLAYVLFVLFLNNLGACLNCLIFFLFSEISLYKLTM